MSCCWRADPSPRLDEAIARTNGSSAWTDTPRAQAPPRYAPRPMLGAIDHVGIAVEDIETALPVYRDSLGLPLVHRETVAEQGVDAALLDVGDGHVELLSP